MEREEKCNTKIMTWRNWRERGVMVDHKQGGTTTLYIYLQNRKWLIQEKEGSMFTGGTLNIMNNKISAIYKYSPKQSHSNQKYTNNKK